MQKKKNKGILIELKHAQVLQELRVLLVKGEAKQNFLHEPKNGILTINIYCQPWKGTSSCINIEGRDCF